MDKLSKTQRSRNMAKVKNKNTSLELAVRKSLHSKGFRYRLHRDLPGKPDIVFAKKQIAVFVNGCFWHNHGCLKSKLPETNSDFWRSKLEGNRLRDENNTDQLKELGWTVFTLWECELKKDFENTLKPLIQELCTQ